ncbi:MAG: ABC-F family ATP-binding cassette domain-containing protein [Chloroflexota bacterium]
MNLVTLENISKQFSERQLLNQVGLLLNSGDRIGLIGVNGSGKTTLLRIIAGLEPPDNGQRTVWGGVRIKYLPQEPELDDELTVLEQVFTSEAAHVRLLYNYERISQQLQASPNDPALQEQFTKVSDEMDRSNGWAAEADAKAVLTKLGITKFGAKVRTLSGGERKRVALAQGLIDPADLLILDEPTNHIDADTVDWLETYLQSLQGALLMVTHDRYFLDRVANRIIELDRRQLISYSGNYTRYLEKKAEREAQLAEAEEKRQSALRRELAWLHRSPMARGTKQKARKQRVAELQEIQYDRGNDQIMMSLASRRLGTKVLEAKGLAKAYGATRLFQDVDFRLERGDRIGIIGPNGAGKSTLLDILLEETKPDSGTVDWGETVRFGYYDQQSRRLPDDMKVVDFIDSVAPVVQLAGGSRIEAPQILEWFLFTRPQQRAWISSLSGGEKRRLYLLSVLAQQPNVLLLDEPTNDLDVQTLATLETFLDHFRGSLVVVSHDRYFLDRTVDFLAVFDNGRFSPRYPAPYSTYQRLRQEAEATNQPPAPPKATPKPPKPAADKPRRLTWKEKRELEELDAKVEALEMEKEGLQEAINNIGSDYQRLQTLSEQLEQCETQLEEVFERWLELTEIAEGS